MVKKKFITYFIILFLPMLIVSTLINLSYSLNAHDYIQINWLIVILIAIVLDAFIAWIHTRKEEEKNLNKEFVSDYGKFGQNGILMQSVIRVFTYADYKEFLNLLKARLHSFTL
jgi:hypothetical protein